MPTGSEDMPTGTATYTGWMYADAYDNTLDSISTLVARSRVRGSLVLTVDFADAAVEGRIFRLSIQRPGVDYDDREHLPSSTRGEVSDGEIADGNFTAALTGVDDNANAPLSENVRGFTGDASGRFYGPNAREFGAAVTAARAIGGDDDWAVVGYLGGTRTDVVGEHTDNEPLPAGVTFCRWRKEYGGMSGDQLRRLKELECTAKRPNFGAWAAAVTQHGVRKTERSRPGR